MRRFYVSKNHAEGKARRFPLKVVDTPLWIRHLHVTAALSAGEKPGSNNVRSEEKRDGEEEGKEGEQEA
jgi:hypothetical protein